MPVPPLLPLIPTQPPALPASAGSSSTGSSHLSVRICAAVVECFDCRLAQVQAAAAAWPDHGLEQRDLFLGAFLACMDEELAACRIKLGGARTVPAELDALLRQGIGRALGDPQHGAARMQLTGMALERFQPDAVNALTFLDQGFDGTAIGVLPPAQRWRLCINQRKVRALARLGINLDKNPLVPLLSENKAKVLRGTLSALRHAMDHGDAPLNLTFLKQLHAWLTSCSGDTQHRLDNHIEACFTVLIDTGSTVDCVREFKVYEAEVKAVLPRYAITDTETAGKTLMRISRPPCTVLALETLLSAWLREYEKLIGTAPQRGVRYAVTLCQKIGRLGAFADYNARLCDVLLNHLLAQQQRRQKQPELAAAQGMSAHTYGDLLGSSSDAMTARVTQARLDFAAACTITTARRPTAIQPGKGTFQRQWLAAAR